MQIGPCGRPHAASAGAVRTQFLTDLETLQARLVSLAEAIPAEKYRRRPVMRAHFRLVSRRSSCYISRMPEAQQPEGTAPETTPPPCPRCGSEMWDNRETKKNPRAPDFKCKAGGCEGVIWPPREAGAVPVVAAPAGTPDDPACPVCAGKMWDDRASKRNPRAPDFKCRNRRSRSRGGNRRGRH